MKVKWGKEKIISLHNFGYLTPAFESSLDTILGTLLGTLLHISLSVREKQILDYQTQQLKLLPLIASTYAFLQAGLYMLKLHFQCRAEIAEGNLKSLPEVGAL